MRAHAPAQPCPVSLTVHRASRVLEVVFDDGLRFEIGFELMRVYSPSAEVRGHGPGQQVLQSGKRDVLIDAIEMVGNYAIRPHFSDGHDSGIYTWDELYRLGADQHQLWRDYEASLAAAGRGRDDPMPTAAAPACSHGSHDVH